MSHLFKEGNQLAKKLTTPELKMEAYKQYCEHLAKGKVKESWYFDHPDLTICCRTMETYIKEEPQVFHPIQKERAIAQGLNRWEQVCEDSAEGINEKANTASLQMIMRNKFKWDKEEKAANFSPQELDKLSTFFASLRSLQPADKAPAADHTDSTTCP